MIRMSNQFRVGNGYDVHRLVAGKSLIIGGVTIPWHMGLEGYSDADVLLHAICDACLGGIGQGDIGRHFPSSEQRYRNADSRYFLRHVAQLLRTEKWQINNFDCIVVAERPPLVGYISEMCKNIASDMCIDASQVNVKATTTDGLGFCGAEQGIAAYAVVLLEKIEKK